MAAFARAQESPAGRGRVVARSAGDRTALAVARATSPLRLLHPSFAGVRSRAVCLVTLGGGLVAGDAIEVDVEVEEGATLVLFTQSTTKAFRGASRQSLRAVVRGTLVLLPDPVACFRGARYEQRVDVSLQGEGACVVLDGITSGRAAYGERWAMDQVDLRTTVRRDGRVVLRDALYLDARDGALAARMDRFDALATVFAVGERARPMLPGLLATAVKEASVVAAPGPLPACPEDGALVRIAAASPALALGEARRRLRNLPDIDAVDPFGSRH